MKMISDETMVPDFSHRLSPYTGHNPKPMDPARLLKALGGSDENAKYLGAFPNKNGELWDVWYVEEKKLLVFDARTENRSFSKLAQDMANETIRGSYGDARPPSSPECAAGLLMLRLGEVVPTAEQLAKVEKSKGSNLYKDFVRWGLIPE